MKLRSESQGHVLVLTVEDSRLDAYSTPEFRDFALEAITPRTMLCIVDLSRVTFLDSTGLGALVALMNTLGRGRRMELCGLTPPVRKVFKITRLFSVFSIRPDVESAIAANLDMLPDDHMDVPSRRSS